MKYLKLFENLKVNNLLDAIRDDDYDSFIRFADKDNVNYKDTYGNTMLMNSCYGDESDDTIKIIKKLIELGANINAQNILGETPLMIAASNYNMSVMRILIGAGADWDIKNSSGQDFVDTLYDDDKETIMKEYKNKFAEYEARKEGKKYNL